MNKTIETEAYLAALRRGEIEPRILDYKFKDPPPFDHQKRMFEWGRRLKRCAILAEQGTGKSRVALDVIQYRLNRGKINNVLIVCPLSVISSWQDEIEKWIESRWRFPKPVVLIGTKKKRLECLERGKKTRAVFYIVNYDGARVIKNELKEIKFGMIVLDEAILVKNRAAQRTKALLNICKGIQYRMIMTGSPITQSPLDLWSQYYILDEGETLGYNYFQYRAKYFYEYKMGQFSKWIPKKWATDAISGKIYKTSIRYTKEQCLDLPEKVFQK